MKNYDETRRTQIEARTSKNSMQDNVAEAKDTTISIVECKCKEANSTNIDRHKHRMRDKKKTHSSVNVTTAVHGDTLQRTVTTIRMERTFEEGQHRIEDTTNSGEIRTKIEVEDSNDVRTTHKQEMTVIEDICS